MKRGASALLSLAALLFAGCPSSTLMHTARPVRVGMNQVGINAVGFNPRTSTDSVTLPTFEVQVRRGVTESADLGLKYSFPLTLSLDYNVLLANGAIPISLDPTISPMYLSTKDEATGTTSSVFWAWGYLPVLFDVIDTQSVSLTLSPRLGFLYASARSTGDSATDFARSGMTWTYGGGLGVKFKLADTFAIMPEASFLAPFDGGWTVVQGAVGFLF